MQVRIFEPEIFHVPGDLAYILLGCLNLDPESVNLPLYCGVSLL